MKYAKLVRVSSLLFFILSIAACSTPEAIRQLSTEQIRTQEQVHLAIDKSFNAMEAVVKLQLEDIRSSLSEANRQMLLNGAKDLQAKNSDLTPENFTEVAENAINLRQKILVKAQSKLVKLEQAHRNVLNAYAKTIEAQQVLDRYLQLQKADEKIANELLAAIGVERQAMDQWIDSGLNAFADVQELLAN